MDNGEPIATPAAGRQVRQGSTCQTLGRGQITQPQGRLGGDGGELGLPGQRAASRGLFQQWLAPQRRKIWAVGVGQGEQSRLDRLGRLVVEPRTLQDPLGLPHGLVVAAPGHDLGEEADRLHALVGDD